MALLGRCPMALAADIHCSSTGPNSRFQILLSDRGGCSFAS